MAEYSHSHMDDWVVHNEQGSLVPITDPDYVAWLEAGGVPDPYVPLPDNITPNPMDNPHFRLDTGVQGAVTAWNANTPQAAPGGGGGGQGGLSVEERLTRLEASLTAMAQGQGLSTNAPVTMKT
jgi:hypothetical protein